MSEERILLKFIVGQRVVKQGEDSRFEGEVVACFVSATTRPCATWSRTMMGCCTLRGSELRLAMPKRQRADSRADN